MQSRKDGALRKIVEDGKLPIKTRRAALAEMEAPSRALLVKLANDSSGPANLRLDASRRLPEAEHRLAGERMARARRSEPEEARREEIDRILAEVARELEADEAPKSTPPNVAPSPLLEPQPPASVVPLDGVLSEAVSQSEQPAVRISDSIERKRELLTQGRALAASILAQLGIMSHAPLNWHAGQKKLEQLQADFLAWERAMRVDYPDIDTLKEFPDSQLRPPPKIIDARTYQAHRRVMTLDEALSVPQAQAKATHTGSDFWDGIPAGL